MSEQEIDRLRRAMVASQLRPNLVTNVAVLAAMDMRRRGSRFVGEGQGDARLSRHDRADRRQGRGLNPPVVTGRLLDAADPRAGRARARDWRRDGLRRRTLYAAIGCVVTALEEAPLIERARQALAGDSGRRAGRGAARRGRARRCAPYDIIHIDGAVEQRARRGRHASWSRMAAWSPRLLDRGVSRLAVGTARGGDRRAARLCRHRRACFFRASRRRRPSRSDRTKEGGLWSARGQERERR